MIMRKALFALPLMAFALVAAKPAPAPVPVASLAANLAEDLLADLPEAAAVATPVGPAPHFSPLRS